jgi:hypothetical protein
VPDEYADALATARRQLPRKRGPLGNRWYAAGPVDDLLDFLIGQLHAGRWLNRTLLEDHQASSDPGPDQDPGPVTLPQFANQPPAALADAATGHHGQANGPTAAQPTPSNLGPANRLPNDTLHDLVTTNPARC